MSMNSEINPKDYVSYNSNLEKYVFTINKKLYSYEQLKGVDFFNRNSQYKIVEEYYLNTLKEKEKILKEKEQMLKEKKQRHEMLKNLTEVTTSMTNGVIKVDTLKDDAAIKMLRKQIIQLKKEYPPEKIDDIVTKTLYSMIEKSEKFTSTIYDNMEDNVLAFTGNILTLCLKRKMRNPEYYEKLIDFIKVSGELYHGVGNAGYWTSVYLRKPVYNEVLDNGLEGLWYAVYKGSITVGAIPRKHKNSSNGKSDDYKAPKRPTYEDSTKERPKKETKPHETNDEIISLKVNSEIDEDIKRISNYKKLSNIIDEEIKKNSKSVISIVMQCTIITPFKSTIGNGLLEIDLKNPGIYSTAADMLSGAKTYAFRNAAASLFEKLRGIKWSSATGTSGLGTKTIDDIREFTNSRQIEGTIKVGMIEDTLFISDDQINAFNQLQGASQMNNNNRTITEGNENGVVTNMTNTTNEENVNIQTINNTNTYQEINVPIQPGTEMEEVGENQ